MVHLPSKRRCRNLDHVPGDADIAASAALLADRTRAEMVAQLSDGRAMPASELAARTGVSRPTASAHLDKLRQAGWLRVDRQGRHRYYRLADPALAQALEALARVSPARPVRGLRADTRGAVLREARFCYDHLAGRLGVELTEELRLGGILEEADGRYDLTPKGEARLEAFGLDVAALRRKRRSFAHPCLDWSERRHHLAGALGAGLADRLVELGWVRRRRETRAVRLTAAGRERLRETFGLG